MCGFNIHGNAPLEITQGGTLATIKKYIINGWRLFSEIKRRKKLFFSVIYIRTRYVLPPRPLLSGAPKKEPQKSGGVDFFFFAYDTLESPHLYGVRPKNASEGVRLQESVHGGPVVRPRAPPDEIWLESPLISPSKG